MTQKRSRHIDLRRMRKAFALKPLAVGIAAIITSGCSDNRQDAKVYVTVDECKKDHPDAVQKCESAYEDAIAQANEDGPRFDRKVDCEYDFGYGQCRRTSSGDYFMPFMAGFMVSQLLSPRAYHTQPLYSSYMNNSPFRNRWVTPGGQVVGSVYNRNFKVPSSTFDSKPKVNRTMSRGGFGSSVRAKSSWGSSSRSGGWGG